MLNYLSDLIVFVLFLPVLMHIILPLGMLAGWLGWRALKLLFGKERPVTEKAGFTAQGLTVQ